MSCIRGGNEANEANRQSPASTVINYFREQKEDWYSGLPTWRSIVYENLWPGIDLNPQPGLLDSRFCVMTMFWGWESKQITPK